MRIYSYCFIASARVDTHSHNANLHCMILYDTVLYTVYCMLYIRSILYYTNFDAENFFSNQSCKKFDEQKSKNWIYLAMHTKQLLE